MPRPNPTYQPKNTATMKAPYDFFLTPRPTGDEGPETFHARVVVRGTVSTRDIARRVAQRCTIKEADVMGALAEVARILQQDMAAGYSVHLDEIGSFRLRAQSPTVESTRGLRAEHIRVRGVVFTPERRLLNALQSTRFERVAQSHRSCSIDASEIDERLTVFFRDHDYITTAQMRTLCGLSYATALRRLQERVQEGRLTHPGHRRAPFYFPAEGAFGSLNATAQTDRDKPEAQ